MKAVIYARYSSDLQSDSSIDDQVRLCTAFIAGRQWQQGPTYFDKAISGSIRCRPHYQQMLGDARSGLFTIIVAESLDRLSRDQEDIAALFKNAAFLGIKIITVAEGEISELHIGLKGTMNALYLKDLAQKTKRGMEGKVREGKFAGGNAYGYRTIKEFDGAGGIITGRREILPDEAEVVRRIFEDFSYGKSPRHIAKELNTENIPGPGGRKWRDSAIRGHFKKGTGILNNDLYAGRLVWNKQRFIKDPATGKRVSRLNAREQWVIQGVPELRIISDNLWKSVKARQNVITAQSPVRCGTNSMTGSRRNKYLLSGLLICGECNGGFTLIAKDKYGCANRRNTGTCSNDFLIGREELEHKILAGIQHKLLEPELLRKFIDEYTLELEKLAASTKQEQAIIRRELTTIDKRLSAVLNAIEQGIVTETTKARLIELETKKNALASQIEEVAPLPSPDKRLIALYQEKVSELCRGIAVPELKLAAMDSIRGLIDRIVIPSGSNAVALYGELAKLVDFEEDGSFLDSKKISVVAGARFELTTFRL
ncbi:MAG: recombinase family protein [Alphaproteobacteria bacterium]|nr:recombinase family protein [Alphaproteobacteria bacterium]